MENKQPKMLFSYTDEYGETITLEKTYNPENCEDFDTIYWWLDEFKYFLQAMSFSSVLTDRLVYLEKDEEVVIKKED